MTVTDNDGATGTASRQITVTLPNQPPVAGFTYTPANPTTLDVVSFTDTSTDSDGTVVAWAWAFGDGATSTAQSPTHRYASTGTYTATLTVTDDDGSTDTARSRIRVTAPPQPSLQVSLSNVRWEDRTNRILAVDAVIQNAGSGAAVAVTVTSVTPGTGATLLSPPVPIALGDIAAGGSATTTLRFQVAAGVRGFTVTLVIGYRDLAGTPRSRNVSRTVTVPK